MTTGPICSQIEVPLALVGKTMLAYLDDGQEAVIVCDENGVPLMFQAPQRVRYTTSHKHLISQMAFTSQDLLVLFGSFGMALFALNIYKITTAQG